MTNMATRKPARYNVAEAKARFSALVRKAMAGEDVIIAKDNKPILKLVPLEPPKRRREPGSAKGKIGIAPDFDEVPTDFDEYV
jgi:prevent-host-death family protein